MDHVGDVIIFNLNIETGADFANQAVGHGDDTHLKAPAKLHIWLGVAQEHHIGGEAAHINDKRAGGLLQQRRLGYHCRVCLGIDHHIPDDKADRCVVECELYGATLKITGEFPA